MSILVSCPDKYVQAALNPQDWPGSSQNANYTGSSRSHLSGNTSTNNGVTLGENINSGRGGSIYVDSGGFWAQVQTKTSSTFTSKHFVGTTSNAGYVKEGNLIPSDQKSTWLRDVTGFHCEVSSSPPSGGGSENDGCGKVEKIVICAVYADANRYCRIMDMCVKGVKKGEHSYDSTPGSWKKMCYVLKESDANKVINGGWMLWGWVIEMKHRKTCGGSTKQKNCRGSIRYLRPIVSSNATYATAIKEQQLVFHWETTLAHAKDPSAQPMALQHH